ncbi:TPA: endonuclease VII domain-containing protein [Salmonella enterica subsp. enterica]|nr:hypothetical protein [Salmonella enterica]ECC5261034.1 hypothetical protein [Salmonella enterica]MIL94145.1 hypothetical protein [Salmonella enterica]
MGYGHGKKDPVKYAAYLERQRKYKKEKRKESDPWYKPEIAKNLSLKRLYGITHEEYKQMWAKQEGVCKICGEPETSAYKGVTKMLAVDHNHQTGEIRGLLCNNCNRGIGLLREDREILKIAIEYLGG